MATNILEMAGVRKSFGAVVALDDVSLKVRHREIHGLLGGNGAGKTTLMNVLYGLYKPDEGRLSVDGRPIEILSPRQAINYGIGMVHQHFLQVNNFTVAENVVLGTAVRSWPTIQLDQEIAKIKELSERFGLAVDPTAVIEDLPMGVRQRVEILKALYRGIRILILDEPTTNLTPQEVDSLFRSLRVMVSEGLSVIFITHKLREVLTVCDRISVLRQGRNVLTLDRENASEEAFVKAMVGEELDIEKSLLFSEDGLDEERLAVGQVDVLTVKHLNAHNPSGQLLLKDISFSIHEKEILGIAGVAGNGQQALAECLLGILPAAGGRIQLNGADISGLPTKDRLGVGMCYVPEDRLDDGFLPKANVAQNLILGHHRHEPYSNGRFLNLKNIAQSAKNLIVEFNIKTQGPDDVGANLSGGNIQRVMLARAFSQPGPLMIVHNPTQGLDIPSIESVYLRLLALKEKGMATLLISEDMDELFLLCNRIAVIFEGELVGVLDREEFDKYELGRLMSGVKNDG